MLPAAARVGIFDLNIHRFARSVAPAVIFDLQDYSEASGLRRLIDGQLPVTVHGLIFKAHALGLIEDLVNEEFIGCQCHAFRVAHGV